MIIVIEGEVALPLNPNCFLFAARPNDVLRNRSWLEVQKVAIPILEEFHGTCGIDTTLWFGRQAEINRFNQEHAYVTMMFVFDGLSSREDLKAIETQVKSTQIAWSPGTMTPLPRRAFPSLIVKSGKVYQVWIRTDDGPRSGHLTYDNELVRIRFHSPDDVDSSQFVRMIRHIEGTRQQPRPPDIELERLKMAFALRISERIVEADGKVVDGEAHFIEHTFPFELLDKMGLTDITALDKAWEQSCEQLPNLLGHHEKLALIGIFFAACHSGGTLATEEMRVLKDAAVLLGLEGSEVVEYISRLW